MRCGEQRIRPSRLCASTPFPFQNFDYHCHRSSVQGNTTSREHWQVPWRQNTPQPSFSPRTLLHPDTWNGGGSYRRAGKALDWTHGLRCGGGWPIAMWSLWSALRYLSAEECGRGTACTVSPKGRQTATQTRPAVFLLSVRTHAGLSGVLRDLLRLPMSVLHSLRAPTTTARRAELG